MLSVIIATRSFYLFILGIGQSLKQKEHNLCSLIYAISYLLSSNYEKVVKHAANPRQYTFIEQLQDLTANFF